MEVEAEDDIEWRRRVGDKKLTEDNFVPFAYKPVAIDNKTLIDYLKSSVDANAYPWANSYTDSISGTWSIDKTDSDLLKGLADTGEKLVVKSERIAKLIKAMGVKVYSVMGLNFVKQSDMDSVEDKI